MPFGQYNSNGTGGASNKWARSKSTKSNTPKVEDDPFSIAPIQKQIDNAQLRIKDAGGEVNPDKRNWFEKATNLPQGQNWLFDTLDLLGRPQQALYQAVDAAKDGDTSDLASKVRGGFAGTEKRLSGADFLEDMGVENKYVKHGLGFVADVVLDPVNLIPGGAIAKVGGKVLQPVKKGYQALETALPQLEKGRDALGRAFIPDYKLDETLYGTKDATIKNLKQQTDNAINYMSEEAVKNVADTAKRAGGINTGDDVGRIMERDVVMNGPRPLRQLSTDPKIKLAADTLMKSNDDIRKWATDNGIPVGELEGYMTHILSAEERARRKNLRVMPIDRGNSGLGQPNKKVLNSRTLQGSAEDVNDQLGRKFFEPNAFFSTAAGQKRLIEYGNSVMFRRQVLSNSDFAQPYAKGMAVPNNATVIDTTKYSFLKDPTGQLSDEIGGEYLVTKSVKEALDRYQKLTTDEGVRGVLRAFDTLTNTWKKLALFSVGYHVRNVAGGLFNSYVAGMKPHELAKFGTESTYEVLGAVRGKESKMYNEFRQQGLGATNLSKVEFKTSTDPEKALEKTVQERSRGIVGQVGVRLNPLRAFETSREAGDVMDQVNRYSLYKWARSKGLNAEEAAAKVREVHFDYTKTTNAEREVFTRAMPFYRWVRNNLPFQARQIINNPQKYMNMNKLRLNLQDMNGINEEEAPQFMKEQFAVPVNEKQFLGLNLPLSDLTKISDPLKMGADGLSPLVKLPIELSSNFNLFKKKEIQKFEGQEKKYEIGGKEFGVPIKTAYALEQMGGQLGRGFSQYLQKEESVDQEGKFLTPTLGINSLLKPYDKDKEAYYRKYRELNELQDLINYLEQQTGLRPRTVNEIKKDSK